MKNYFSNENPLFFKQKKMKWKMSSWIKGFPLHKRKNDILVLSQEAAEGRQKNYFFEKKQAFFVFFQKKNNLSSARPI